MLRSLFCRSERGALLENPCPRGSAILFAAPQRSQRTRATACHMPHSTGDAKIAANHHHPRLSARSYAMTLMLDATPFHSRYYVIDDPPVFILPAEMLIDFTRPLADSAIPPLTGDRIPGSGRCAAMVFFAASGRNKPALTVPPGARLLIHKASVKSHHQFAPA